MQQNAANVQESAAAAEEMNAQAAELMRIDLRFSLERRAKTSRYRDPADTQRVLDALRKAGLK